MANKKSLPLKIRKRLETAGAPAAARESPRNTDLPGGTIIASGPNMNDWVAWDGETYVLRQTRDSVLSDSSLRLIGSVRELRVNYPTLGAGRVEVVIPSSSICPVCSDQQTQSAPRVVAGVLDSAVLPTSSVPSAPDIDPGPPNPDSHRRSQPKAGGSVQPSGEKNADEAPFSASTVLSGFRSGKRLRIAEYLQLHSNASDSECVAHLSRHYPALASEDPTTLGKTITKVRRKLKIPPRRPAVQRDLSTAR
jgi:hypothetical protein